MKLFEKLSVKKNEVLEKTAGKKFFTKKRIIIITAVILVIVIAFFATKMLGADKKEIEIVVSDHEVVRGDITSSITGTATINPKDSYEITSLVSGTVLSANFEEGDEVMEGDLLYTIDSSDIANNVERAKMNYETALEDQINLNVKSDHTGVISKVYVSEGDEINKGAVIADIIDEENLKIEIPFNENDADYINIGDSATLSVVGTGSTLYGKVSKISNNSLVKDGYALVKYVTVNVTSPGTLTDQNKATAIINGKACNDAGNFEYITNTKITAKSQGKVENLYISRGDKVYKGNTVAVLSSDSVKNSVKNASMSLSDATESLEDYNITAPIAGTVISKNIKAGDNLDTASFNSVMAIIYDMSYLTFDISIDELDIQNVKKGQNVIITSDAIEGVKYEGIVDKVSIVGTTSGGVTVYPVTVNIYEFDDRLLPGMNVNAEIIIESASDVLLVPITAVNRGNTVYVKDALAKKDDNGNIDGYRLVSVTLGRSDSENVEIKEGLLEGDLVRVETITNSGMEINPAFDRMGGGNMGGMPSGGMNGGMSGGGMPSGSMNGGMNGGMSGGNMGGMRGNMGGR